MAFLFMRPFLLLTFFLSLLVANPSWGGSGKTDRDVAELKQLQETNGRILAEAIQNISTIRQEIQEIRGALEETKHFFQEESKKNEKLLREFDYRLTGVEERLSLYGGQLQEFLQKPEIPTSRSKKKGRADDREETLYRRALAEINSQNFKSAIQLFDQFIQKHPKSSLADNAQYWKGEAYYASKQFPQAILEFQQVVKKYPRSDKVPAAVLKQGFSFYESENYLDAKAFLQKVITDFPGTDEAAQAKERLEKIEQTLAKKGPNIIAVPIR